MSGPRFNFANADICCKYFNLYRLATYIYQYMHINCTKITSCPKTGTLMYLILYNLRAQKIPNSYLNSTKSYLVFSTNQNVYVPNMAVQWLPIFSSHSKVLVSYHDPMTRNPHRFDRVFPQYFNKKFYDARLNAMIEMMLECHVYWDITPCRLVNLPSFRKLQCRNLQGRTAA
jgi:hypothetical protein